MTRSKASGNCWPPRGVDHYQPQPRPQEVGRLSRSRSRSSSSNRYARKRKRVNSGTEHSNDETSASSNSGSDPHLTRRVMHLSNKVERLEDKIDQILSLVTQKYNTSAGLNDTKIYTELLPKSILTKDTARKGLIDIQKQMRPQRVVQFQGKEDQSSPSRAFTVVTEGHYDSRSPPEGRKKHNNIVQRAIGAKEKPLAAKKRFESEEVIIHRSSINGPSADTAQPVPIPYRPASFGQATNIDAFPTYSNDHRADSKILQGTSKEIMPTTTSSIIVTNSIDTDHGSPLVKLEDLDRYLSEYDQNKPHRLLSRADVSDL